MQTVNSAGKVRSDYDALRASGNGDDAMRAYSLFQLCLNALPKSSSNPLAGVLPTGAAFDSVERMTRDRCESLGDSVDAMTRSINELRGSLAAAREAGSLLARLPNLGVKDALQEMEPSRFDALRAALMTEGGAEVWLATNMQGLRSALQRAPEYSELPPQDLTAALFLGLCASDGCDGTSLYLLPMCRESLGKTCNVGGVRAAALQAYGETRTASLQDIGERILDRLRKGELEAVGLRRKQ